MAISFPIQFSFRCWHCGKKLTIASQGLCSFCMTLIQTPPYCLQCGNALPHFAKRCGKCTPLTDHWQQMIVAGRYQEPLSILIHRFKFQDQFYLDKTLARLLTLAILTARRNQYFPLPEIILPVPLHHQRQWQRGYNQSALIARYLTHWLKIPTDERFLQRSKKTSPQRGLKGSARRKNLQGAFEVSEKFYGKYQRVAVVDDVITTGATLAEISKTLKRAGVKEIQVWGVART